MKRSLTARAFRSARRVVVTIVGLTVVIIGLAMIVLPGPAVVVIPLGLAILATEFAWARRLLHRLRAFAGRLRGAGDRRSRASPEGHDGTR